MKLSVKWNCEGRRSTVHPLQFSETECDHTCIIYYQSCLDLVWLPSPVLKVAMI